MNRDNSTYNNKETDLSLLELWQWKFSDIYDLQDVIAEYIVEKALGMKESFNVGYWTLYDIEYRGKRIEIKETGYYHSWQKEGDKISEQRTFSITKAYSNYKDNSSTYERQNDIYVFCLNIGRTREESNPMELNNWEFYIVPTKKINELCRR